MRPEADHDQRGARGVQSVGGVFRGQARPELHEVFGGQPDDVGDRGPRVDPLSVDSSGTSRVRRFGSIETVAPVAHAVEQVPRSPRPTAAAPAPGSRCARRSTRAVAPGRWAGPSTHHRGQTHPRPAPVGGSVRVELVGRRAVLAPAGRWPAWQGLGVATEAVRSTPDSASRARQSAPSEPVDSRPPNRAWVPRRARVSAVFAGPPPGCTVRLATPSRTRRAGSTASATTSPITAIVVMRTIRGGSFAHCPAVVATGAVLAPPGFAGRAVVAPASLTIRCPGQRDPDDRA